MNQHINNSSVTLVARQEEWNKVAGDLEAENLKLASYDNTLVPLLGDLKDKKILDYGAGPGILALGLQRLGADAKVWDINPELVNKSAEKIGDDNVYRNIEDVPRHYFDAIICNLVLCIVPEDEVRRILTDLKEMLNDTGHVYIGFCNPRIYDVHESQLDLRFQTGDAYEMNHEYKKVKKEGGYEIIETHRPVEWYVKEYEAAGLELVETFFTPEYELNGVKIKDFVIFKLGLKK